ncbi:hypothetical protein AQJ30_12540 [Streptomyces longwoodensis]|uniref:Uncharacterized protein n=1 Tax=Streptomyces longwoodensis TaxID=68231 RepID=A0A101QYH5_9ACTN|nr:hypothetical protein [Streptomyces longwoodensis]KUN38401.1 hypothetical protein AQJ30_12540 [Streptomyces longwoodensis]
MPARSRDVAALRRFAEAHAAAHARAATVRPDASCGCRQSKCSAHEGARVTCAGTVVLVLRHDPAVGQVWTLTEVCSACAPLMTHARVVGHATPRARQEMPQTPRPVVEHPVGGPEVVTAGAEARAVPGGFSAPAAVAAVPAEDARRGGGVRRRRGR